MSAADNITAAIKQALRECSADEVVSVVTGNFVGLIVAMTEQHGGEAGGEIHIDGGASRDITIHAKKGGAA